MELKNHSFFLSLDTISPDSIWSFYQNIELELKASHLSHEQKSLLSDYYCEAGLLRWSRRPYFRRHFSDTFAKSVNFLFAKHRNPCILDLGSGCGTQSILFAAFGAKVFALDTDSSALEVLSQRKTFYETLLGRHLSITTLCENALTFSYATISPLDGVFSLFAFNMMSPSNELLEQLLPAMSPEAAFAILDGNSLCWLPRFIPSRRRSVWSPLQMARVLAAQGLSVQHHSGGVSLPPVAWRCLPGILIAALDDALSSSWLFPISHLCLARRISGSNDGESPKPDS